MTAPVVIIGCGARKAELLEGETVPIGDLYVGHVFRAREAYARIWGGPHYVVSGHYGLVPVGTEVVAYELDLRREAAAARAAWTERVLLQLVKAIPSSTPLIVLAAGPYLSWCNRARDLGYSIEAPLEGMEIGASLRWLKRAIAARPAEVAVADARDFAQEAAAIRAELDRDQPLDHEEWTISTGALRALIAGAAA